MKTVIHEHIGSIQGQMTANVKLFCRYLTFAQDTHLSHMSHTHHQPLATIGFVIENEGTMTMLLRAGESLVYVMQHD